MKFSSTSQQKVIYRPIVYLKSFNVHEDAENNARGYNNAQAEVQYFQHPSGATLK